VSIRDARSRFGGALVANKSYHRHGNAPDDPHPLKLRRRRPWLLLAHSASASCYDGECRGLEEITAERAGQQSDQSVSHPPKSILMECHRREMSADDTAS
jgi:hypothetical protein